MDSLNQRLVELGIEIPSASSAIMEEHARLVLEVNQSLNLTRIVDWPDVLRLHLLDSLLALPAIQAAPAGALLDIGSGAGFPGIPLAISSERPCVLVESIKKKAEFLLMVCEKLELAEVQVVALRVEEVAAQPDHRGAYAVVVARAVSQLSSLVELASPLLISGGVFVALKANVDDEELRLGRSVAVRVGLSRETVKRYTLPGGTEQRCLVSYTRIGQSEVNLPRRVGLAQKRPLV